jgi:Na+-driven multidrug efflux pump
MIHLKKKSLSFAARILKDSMWAGTSQLTIAVTGLINMALVAHLGTKAVLVTAAVQLITFIYMAIDGGYRQVTGPLIAQCSSNKMKNLPPSLDKQKNKLFEEDKKQQEVFDTLVQTIIVQSVYQSLQLAAPLMLLVFFVPETLLAVFGAKTAISPEAIRYSQLMLGTILLNSTASMCVNTLRNIGETKVLAHGSTLRLSFHIIPGVIGVYFLNWGLMGVAASAIAGQLAGCCYLGYHLKKKVFCKKLASLHPKWQLQWHTIQSAWPLIIDLLMFHCNQALFRYMLQDYGENVLAAHRIAESIINVPAALLIGFGTTVSREVGKAYGDNNYKHVQKITWTTSTLVLIFATVLYSTIALLGPWICFPFTNGSAAMSDLTQKWLWLAMLVRSVSINYSIFSRSLKAMECNRVILISSIVSNCCWCGIMFLTWHYFNLLALVGTFVTYWIIDTAIVRWYFKSEKWIKRTETTTV